MEHQRFVTILVEAEREIIRDEFVSEGFNGGQRAARLLRLEAIDYLQQRGLLDPMSTILLYVYADLKKMATLYTQTQVPVQPADFASFFQDLFRLLLNDTLCANVIVAGMTERECWQMLGCPSFSKEFGKLEFSTFHVVFRKNGDTTGTLATQPRKADLTSSGTVTSLIGPSCPTLGEPTRATSRMCWDFVSSARYKSNFQLPACPLRPYRPRFYDEIYGVDEDVGLLSDSSDTFELNPRCTKAVDGCLHQANAKVARSHRDAQSFIERLPKRTCQGQNTSRKPSQVTSSEVLGKTALHLQVSDQERGDVTCVIRKEPSIHGEVISSMSSLAIKSTAEGFSEGPTIQEKIDYWPIKGSFKFDSMGTSSESGPVRSPIDRALVNSEERLQGLVKAKNEPVDQPTPSRLESNMPTVANAHMKEEAGTRLTVPARRTLKEDCRDSSQDSFKAKNKQRTESLDTPSRSKVHDVENREATNLVYGENRRANLRDRKEAEARQQRGGDLGPPAQGASTGQNVNLRVTREAKPSDQISNAGQSQAQQEIPARSIPRDKQGRRLDIPLEYTVSLVDRMEKLHLCNNYHLKGHCTFPKCKHLHMWDGRELNAEEKQVLRIIARRSPCKYKNRCQDPECYAGHRCTNHTEKGNHECSFDECLHFENSQPASRPESEHGVP
ncbi:MAG: hypothetical protein Q9217_003201 [Psora testacea]